MPVFSIAVPKEDRSTSMLGAGADKLFDGTTDNLAAIPWPGVRQKGNCGRDV